MAFERGNREVVSVLHCSFQIVYIAMVCTEIDDMKENKFVNGGGSNVLRRWQNDGGDHYYRLKCDNLRTWPSGSRWSESNRQDS